MAHKQLFKLGFEYKNIKKDVFVDKHKRLDVVKDCKKFLNTIKDLKPYLVEFEKDRSIKTKNYPDDCAIRKDTYRLAIIIIHDEYTFSANDKI